VASLPLEDGYAVTYPTFDLMTQKVKRMRLEVKGTESVTVPAGTFDAHRVEISSAEGAPGSTILWIDVDSREIVRTEQSLPQMGGAAVVAEVVGESGGGDQESQAGRSAPPPRRR